MTKLVTAEVWRQVVDPHVEGREKRWGQTPTPRGHDEPTVAAVLGTLVPLLPKNLQVLGQGYDRPYVHVHDGRTDNVAQIDSTVLVDIQHDMPDAAGRFASTSAAASISPGTSTPSASTSTDVRLARAPPPPGPLLRDSPARSQATNHLAIAEPHGPQSHWRDQRFPERCSMSFWVHLYFSISGHTVLMSGGMEVCHGGR
ncbi:hypothetical protein ACIBAG_31345 [Streptomyces sp. NPDC051243]|uniref:hypothetical protein n=1 Tax=Streptomyces sp. NPDC051243 TaxID=3365646 RepID=UPI0037919088